MVFQKVSMENTQREVSLLKLEKEKTDRVLRQWKTEKQHMLDALLQTTYEVDEALRDKEELDKYVCCKLFTFISLHI
jgi:hypothetical protein